MRLFRSLREHEVIGRGCQHAPRPLLEESDEALTRHRRTSPYWAAAHFLHETVEDTADRVLHRSSCPHLHDAAETEPYQPGRRSGVMWRRESAACRPESDLEISVRLPPHAVVA